MKPGYWIFILSLIASAVVIGGCSGINQQSTPTPTPAPTVTVPPANGPDNIGTIHSTQLRLADFDIIQGAGRTGSYSFTLENVGSTEARNVGVGLTVTDMKTHVQQQGTVFTLDRPIPAHGNSTFSIATGLYDTTTESVILNVRIYWGDQLEFWNGYNMTRALPWAPQVTDYANH